LVNLIRLEEPANCEGHHCYPPERDIDSFLNATGIPAVQFAEVVDGLADYHGISTRRLLR
jgi:hypothetical protein